MFTKRHRITLLFNANKAYDRQVVEGVRGILPASQSEWDISALKKISAPALIKSRTG